MEAHPGLVAYEANVDHHCLKDIRDACNVKRPDRDGVHMLIADALAAPDVIITTAFDSVIMDSPPATPRRADDNNLIPLQDGDTAAGSPMSHRTVTTISVSTPIHSPCPKGARLGSDAEHEGPPSALNTYRPCRCF